MNSFYLNFAQISFLTMSPEGCSSIFFIFEKIKKNLVSTHSQKPGFQNFNRNINESVNQTNRCIQNPIKKLGWNFLQKQLTTD